MSDYLDPETRRTPIDLADLYDAETDDVIGAAIYGQWQASSETASGLIVIDGDGDVIPEQDEALWKRMGRQLRRVYVR